MIYLGADHAGFKLKSLIKDHLTKMGHKYSDLGNNKMDPKDDYPDFALAVAKKVAETNSRGILICATGIGSCIAANKVKGVRAALVFNEFTASQSREHNNANVLCFGAKTIDKNSAKKIVKIWLETDFSNAPRHIRRLKKIEQKG